jgi:B-box zinc finger
MDNLLPNELEELIVCSCCHLTFNDSDAQPKLFSCRHYFCLKCISTILLKGKELYCIHCWKRTELPDLKPENLPTYNAILYLSQNMINIKTKKIINADKNQYSPTNISTNLTNKIRSSENCFTHAMPNSLWCLKCNILVCRACASTEDHRNHTVKSLNEAKETIHNDVLSELIKMQKKLTELQHLVFKQRDFLLKILEGCTTLKTQIETELINHIPTLEISDIRGNLSKAKLTLTLLEHQPSPTEAYRLFTSLNIEKQRLHYKYNEMLLQCKLEEIVQNNGSLLDFELLKQISSALNANGIDETQMILNSINNNVTSSTAVSVTNNNNNINNNNNSNIKNNNPTQPTTPISSASSTNSNNPASPFNCNHILANIGHNNMILLLANYCISQLYSHQILTAKTMTQALGGSQSQMNNKGNNNINNNNCNNNSILLNSLSAVGMLPDQMNQLSMQENILHKFSDSQTCNFLSTDLLGNVGHIGNGSVTNFVNAANNRQLHSVSHHTPPPLNFIPDINGIVLQHHSLHSTASNNNLTTSSTTINATNQQPTVASIVQNPSVHVYPIYFFNIEINGSPFGRILIEVRNDVAPKMAKNFGSLCTGKRVCKIYSIFFYIVSCESGKKK